VAELLADLSVVIGEGHVGRHGYSNVGAVVAATKPGDAARLRARMPQSIFLVPGYGAQGGSVETVRPLLDARRGGVLVTASRSVIYPAPADDWQGAIGEAARAFVAELSPLVRMPK
jgi:orotidine-5'-phosphate decarboxylase